jgi:hypothetical protein
MDFEDIFQIVEVPDVFVQRVHEKVPRSKPKAFVCLE